MVKEEQKEDDHAFLLLSEQVERSLGDGIRRMCSLDPVDRLKLQHAGEIEKVGWERFGEALKEYEDVTKGTLSDFYNQYDTFSKYRLLFFLESDSYEFVKAAYASSLLYGCDVRQIFKYSGKQDIIARFIEYHFFGLTCVYVEDIDEFYVSHVKAVKGPMSIFDEENIFEIRLNPSMPFELFEQEIELLRQAGKARYDDYHSSSGSRDRDDFFTDAIGRKRQGKQLPFNSWENCLKVHRLYKQEPENKKNKAEISRQMGWFNPACRPKCTAEISGLLEEARRLIKAAEDGTFLD